MRRNSGLRSRLLSYASLMVLAALFAASARTQSPPAPRPTNQVSLALDTQQSTVHWTLDTTLHTVHGTFLLKRGNVQFDPESGKASGEIVASATSGDSGDEGRDKKMHREVLESEKYPEVVFRLDRIDGKIPASGSWSASIHGIFVLHGAEHELSVPVQGEFTADHWTGTAKFSVPFIQWGLKNPSNFFLKVNHEVAIEIDMQPLSTK
jgi:polyisoprenoid-binding protein YceI